MTILPRGILFTHSLRSAGAALLFAALACAQTGPAGHWEGVLTADNNREIGVTLDLAKNAKSEWIASMGIPSENMTGLVVVGVVVDGNSLKFIGVELMMAKFDLALVPDGKLKGTVTNGPNSRPIEFKRTGEAKVELVPASPAVSQQLEGDWEASIGPPNGAHQLVFHFKNQPDGTVAATIGDDPRLPLNNVKQAGQKVEFGIKIGHASFEGTLNKEGTEIAGQMIHDTNSMPMTLRKK
ncbi:MAG: hypothetical protein ABSC08_06930 [Bryobacteraceae bacterium]|jgi:hypothetical protein